MTVVMGKITKKPVLTATLILVILVLATVAVLVVEKPNISQFNNSNENSLSIVSFTPSTIGSNVTGGSFVLVNPTNNYFENLTLAVKIDDSEPVLPFLRLPQQLPFYPFDRYNVPITKLLIGPSENETIQFYLYDPSQGETAGLYHTMVNVQTFSSHVFRFYVTQSIFGDVVNGQSLTIPQEKGYLQVTGVSSIEHDNDTWHEYLNSSTNRYEYINDQPNFCQQYYRSAFYPMEPNSYNWAKMLNQLDESYFNVTVFNNNTFPVKGITLFGGSTLIEQSYLASAHLDDVLQPNETYVFPVPSLVLPSYAYVSGDLIGGQK